MLRATLQVAASGARAVVLDAGDCRDVLAAVGHAQSLPVTPPPAEVSAFRAQVAPVADCPECAAASLDGPLACYRHALESAVLELEQLRTRAVGLVGGTSGKAGAP